MKLRPKKIKVAIPVEEPKKKRKKQKNTLPPDKYEPMFEPVRVLVRDTETSKGPLKQYLETSVMRFDDDEAKPHVFVQMYQESDFYTGYLKGKSIYLPVESLTDLIDMLDSIREECEERGIEE